MVLIGDVVDRAVEATRGLFEQHGHALVVSLPPEIVTLDADGARLEQVIVNLLVNAAKYTEPGGRVTLVAAREGADAVVRVSDSGIGLAPDMVPRVFDLFAQATRSLSRTDGGLGIGLTLVKRIVELHGGSVAVRSEGLGRGAEFVVHLPALPPAADAGPASPPDEPLGGTPARIVVVEDNRDAAESLAMLLEVYGHSVRVFHDGVAALDDVPAEPPDVMLVDIGLPDVDGYEVARRSRRHPTLRDVVLVALTGYGRREDRMKGYAAGFDHHLVKPIDRATCTT